jgi:hypothetical protein
LVAIAEPHRQDERPGESVGLVQLQSLLRTPASDAGEESLVDRIGIEQSQLTDQGEGRHVAILQVQAGRHSDVLLKW